MNLQARLYDPVIGRFLSVDPLAEIQLGITPYHYCGNDPINAKDPSGLFQTSRAIDEKEARRAAGEKNLYAHLSMLNRWDLEAVSMKQMVLNRMYHSLENYRDLAANGMNKMYTEKFNMLNCWAGGAGGGFITPQESNERDRSDATRVGPVIVPDEAKSVIVREEIAQIARGYENSDLWLKGSSKGSFEAGTYKCNLFVFDVLSEAGASPYMVAHHGFGYLRPALAGEWASGGSIPCWRRVYDPQPGDVVIQDLEDGTGFTGHMGIIVGINESASSDSHFGGLITITDFGFRSDAQYYYYRYYGYSVISR